MNHMDTKMLQNMEEQLTFCVKLTGKMVLEKCTVLLPGLSLHGAYSGHQFIHQRDTFVGHFSCLTSQFSNHEGNEEKVRNETGEK
ncbi:hypothetical protein P5673_017601 [Acropora cervicornis]|uniref:Uncharacterized protein n=1 Tax=Acropora cervicornis TaxID=6130 RepID=A0AAD9QFI7_ACRCE|nr:hypothetical protein P5673_017601 [Acropora cervicornis]